MKKAAAITATMLLVGTSFGYLTDSISFSRERVEATPVHRPIPIAEATFDSTQSFRSFPGSVRASSRVDIAFNVDGLLTHLNGVEGTRVKKDEVLARLDDRDARNGHDAALVKFEEAKRNHERSRLLFKQQASHQSQLDSLKATLDIAAAEKRTRRKALEDTVLRAPFDGIIARRHVEENQHIKGQDVILSLKDVSLIDIVIQVPERIIAKGGIDRFNHVRVQFDAAPEKWYPAQKREYSIEPDPLTRTYEVVVCLSPPQAITVLPGMTATVLLEQQNAADKDGATTVFVPLRSVVGDNDESSYVWVIPAQGGAPEKRTVSIGTMKKDSIQITRGLKPGELVATAGVHSLRQDMQVRPARKNREGLDR